MSLSQIGCPNLWSASRQPGLRTRFLESKAFETRGASKLGDKQPGRVGRRNSLLLYSFERFLISCASFSISSAFFSRFNESTFAESGLSTSAFISVAS